MQCFLVCTEQDASSCNSVLALRTLCQSLHRNDVCKCCVQRTHCCIMHCDPTVITVLQLLFLLPQFMMVGFTRADNPDPQAAQQALAGGQVG